MVEDNGRMDVVFHALAHAARREMLTRLADQSLTVGELAEPLVMSLAAAAKHVTVLERAGLVQKTVVGRRHSCQLDAAPLARASAWLQSTSSIGERTPKRTPGPVRRPAIRGRDERITR